MSGGMAEAGTDERAGWKADRPPAQPLLSPPTPVDAARVTTTKGLVADLALARDRRRLFLIAPFLMLGGLICYAGLPVEPQNWALSGGGIALTLLIVTQIFRRADARAAGLAAAFWSGLCLLPLHALMFATPMLDRPVYGTFEAYVDEVLPRGDDDSRLILSGMLPDPGIRRARVVAGDGTELRAGDRIRANLRLAPIPGPVLPGGFDGQFHGYYSGIGAYGTVTGGLELVAHASGFDFWRSVDSLRHVIGQRIGAVLEGQVAAIGWAMVVGEQGGISEATREVMAEAGLAHVYSISGLHLSIVAGGLYFLCRALIAALPPTRHWPAKGIAAGLGILAALFYLLLAGGPANVPAFRSALMLSLVFGAVLAGRRALTMRNVAIAALAIIVIDPASVFRPSFQLSFAAVVALIGVYELPRRPREELTGPVAWVLRVVVATALTSVVAGAATLLFSAYHFQQTAPLGGLGNVLALPFVGLIMWNAVIGVLLMPLGLEALPLAAMGLGIEGMLEVARLVSGWSAGLESHPIIASHSLLIGIGALAWFAFLPGYWRLAGPALAVPLVVVFGLETAPDVLIADTTQAVAVRDGGNFGLIAGRTGSFAVDVWSETYGQPIASKLDASQCDARGCVVHTAAGYTLALVKEFSAFAEDCPSVDVVITRLFAPAECRAEAQVIDRRDLERGGVHWLRWRATENRFEIRPAIERAARPWRTATR